MKLSISGTHSDFLNQLCELDDYPDQTEFDYLEKDFLGKMTAADWMSWLDKQDGRNKFSKFVKHARNKNSSYPIHYIKVCVIEISSHDYSRLTDVQWSSIPKNIKQVAQRVMTMPFPEINNYNKQLQFKDINLEAIQKSLSSFIETATFVLSTLGLDVYESPQMLKYIKLIIEYINNLILDDIDLEKTLVPLHHKRLRKLYFILFHPDHRDRLYTETFIDYMTSKVSNDIFITYDDDEYYKDLKIFVNSAEGYLKKKIIKSRQEEENAWWGSICNDVFINYFDLSNDISKYVDVLNNILKENPLFMNKMLKCAPEIAWGSARCMSTWKRLGLAKELTKHHIFKHSETGGLLAILLYQVIGIPCLDILVSDMYVNSLSDDDKELLTLWTHACNLFQQKTPSVESIATQKESKNIPDSTRKEWLRNRLYQIFIQAPETDEEHVLYRGLNINCNRVNKMSINPMAVSFDYSVAKGFATDEHGENNGCILYITIPKKSNILAIDRVSIFDGDESEILLMPESDLIDDSSNFTSTGFQQLQVKYSVNGNKKSKFVGLPKPSFIHRKPSLEEFGYILLKSGLIFSTTDAMDHIKMLDELVNGNRKYNTISDALFKAIRTHQILYCGFGDVNLAIKEFWKLAFDIYAKSYKILLLRDLHRYCDAAWSTRKSLLMHNKAATFLDALQEFVKPFAIE